VLAALTAISLGTVTISKAQDSVSRATIELFRGADKNDMEMVKRAIYAGADVRARNSLGQRAHDVAVDLNHMEVAHYILSMRPKARKQPIQQRTVQTTLPTASQIAAKKLPPPVKPLAVKKPKSVAPKPVITKPTSSAVAIRKPAPKVAPIAIAKQMPKPAPKIALVSPAREVKKTAPVSIVKPVQSRQLKPVAKKVPREAAAIPAVKRKPEPITKVVLVSPAPEAGKPGSAAPSINTPQPGEFNFFGNRLTHKSQTKAQCFDKPENISICLQPLKWPKHLENLFDVDTVYYDGMQSLVLYQDGQLKQIHVLFKRNGFNQILKFFSSQLKNAGQTNDLKKTESTQTYFGKDHRIVTWTGLKGSWPDSLELRELDSLRWSSLPDENHGVVRIVKQGADPVFKHISSADFMLGNISTRRKNKN